MFQDSSAWENFLKDPQRVKELFSCVMKIDITSAPCSASYQLVVQHFKELIQCVDKFHKFSSKRFSVEDRVWVKHVDKGNYNYARIIATHQGLYDVQYNDNDIERNVSRLRVTVSIEECCGCNMILGWVHD